MVNLENLQKAVNKEICILLKYGDYMAVSGILLGVEENDIILECKDNAEYANARVLDSEAHVPVSSLASWFLIKRSMNKK